MPSRRRKASDRSERNRERSEKWVRESEGIKDHQCSNQGASLKKKKGRAFRVIVLLHACTHLRGTCTGVCVRACMLLQTSWDVRLNFPSVAENILYSFKPKRGSCSCLVESAAKYAWDPENSPS